MHVLHIIDSLHAGGAESSLADMAPELTRRGIKLDVAYLHERQGVAQQLQTAGATLHSLQGAVSRRRWLRDARSLIDNLAPDVVHTSLFEADQIGRVAARLCRVPVVSSLVGVRYGPEQLANPQFRRSRLRSAQATDIATSRLVRRFHAVSSEVASTMSRRLLVPRGRIEVIHRGRNAEALGVRSDARREAKRAELGIRGAALVLAVGRQEYVKGLDRLVAATALLAGRRRDFQVLVAGGEGNATADLQRQVGDESLASRMRFLGARNDVADLMCAADVLVLPSRSEGFPGVLVEAMMLEAPIVASDIAAVHEVLGERPEARLVDAGDPDALALAIDATLNHRPDVSGLRERALANFGSEAVGDAMAGFYSNALQHSRRQ